MVEWGVCGEGKEWDGLCVGMPSIARAAAGNDANPRLQPATSQTDNEHDASLWRRIPPLAAILPCHRHLVNHPAGFPAEGRAPRPHDRPPEPQKIFLFPCSGSSATCPPLPKKTGKAAEQARPQEVLPGRAKKSSLSQTSCGRQPPVCGRLRWAALSTRPVASGILTPPA